MANVWNQAVTQESVFLVFLQRVVSWTTNCKLTFAKRQQREPALLGVLSAGPPQETGFLCKKMRMEGRGRFMELGLRGELCPGVLNCKNTLHQLVFLVFFLGLESVSSKNM